MYKWKITYEKFDDVNILGLVIFSTALGVILAQTGETAKCLTDMFQAFANAMMGLTKWVIWLSPVGVMALITSKMLSVDSLEELVGQLGKYFLTVVGGLLLQVFVILPAMYFVTTRRSPIVFIVNMGQAIVTAFGTASR